MISVKQMLDKCEGLIDTTDITPWENDFLKSRVEGAQQGQVMSSRQLEILEGIHRKHFA